MSISRSLHLTRPPAPTDGLAPRTLGQPPTGRSLVVTSDPDLLDDALRLALAAGVELEVAGHAAAAARSWSRAPLVLVGADLAAQLAATPPRRRPGILLLVRGADPSEADWRTAVTLGAEHVVAVPAGEQWLVEQLADAERPPGLEAPVVAVVGARGGVGASTLACAVAQRSAGHGRTSALIDLDPWGGGLDLVMGMEDVPGLRWPELCRTSGRLSPAALGEALPRADGLSVLSWDRGPMVEVAAGAVASVLDSARRGFGLVVVDLPRIPDPCVAEALRRASLMVLVVPREIRAVAAAQRVLQAVEALPAPVGVVTRGPSPADLRPEEVATALGFDLLADLRPESRVAAAAERGEPFGSRGQLPRVADVVLAAVNAGQA